MKDTINDAKKNIKDVVEISKQLEKKSDDKKKIEQNLSAKKIN